MEHFVYTYPFDASLCVFRIPSDLWSILGARGLEDIFPSYALYGEEIKQAFTFGSDPEDESVTSQNKLASIVCKKKRVHRFVIQVMFWELPIVNTNKWNIDIKTFSIYKTFLKNFLQISRKCVGYFMSLWNFTIFVILAIS